MAFNPLWEIGLVKLVPWFVSYPIEKIAAVEIR